MKLKPIVALILFIVLFGCTPHPSIEETQPFPTSIVIQPTPTSTTKLQLTYVQLREDRIFTEFNVVDITCVNDDNVCFGEPKLLFQSLEASDSDQDLPKGFILDYDWSPDGTKIVLASGRDILIGDINSQEWTNITNTSEADHEPKWSVDGKFIYYIACIEDSSGMCTPQLIKYNLVSKQKQQLLQAWNTPFSSDYAVSPDGLTIIIVGSSGINNVLYQANWDGTDSHQITTMDVEEFAPSFSPDGQIIAFFRSTIKYSLDSKEQWDIIVRDLITGEERNLTENFDRLAASPVFSPDGKWLVFDAGDSTPKWDVFLVSLETGEIIQVTEDGDSRSPAWRWIQE